MTLLTYKNCRFIAEPPSHVPVCISVRVQYIAVYRHFQVIVTKQCIQRKG